MMAAARTRDGAETVTVSELLAGLVPDEVVLPDVPLTGLSLDTRTLRPGELFFARQGTNNEPGAFVAAALEKGAPLVVAPAGTASQFGADVAALIVEVANVDEVLGEASARFFAHPSHALEVIGVTGTNGKTSVTYLLAQAFTALGSSGAYLGTLGAGFPGDAIAEGLTTPNAIEVNRGLGDLLARGARVVAMEASSHALAQQRLHGLTLRGAVFTNLSHDHLDYHGSEQNYAAAKRRLFAQPGLKWAVINADDEYAAFMAGGLEPSVDRTSVRLVSAAPSGSTGSSGLSGLGGPPAAVALNDTVIGTLRSADGGGIEIDIDGRFGRGHLRSPLIGRFNACNLLLALSCLLHSDVAMADACAALGRCQAPAGRLERVSPPAGSRQPMPVVVVDYSHTPDSLRKALVTLREVCTGELWCVFGCGGDRDRAKRPVMGGISLQHADHSIVTDDNPRGEASGDIIEAILEGMPDRERVTVQADRLAAIRLAVRSAAPDDVVLIAGKGHEPYQEVRGVRRPFSDVEVARTVLRERAS